MEQEPTPPATDLLSQILKDKSDSLTKAADAGASYIRSRLREGERNERRCKLLTDLQALPEGGADEVQRIAGRFAQLLLEEIGLINMRETDARNTAEPSPGVCHSHDFCDANMVMDEAFTEVTGGSLSSLLPDKPGIDEANTLWSLSWDYANLAGLVRLGYVRGNPEMPLETITTSIKMDKGGELDVSIKLPGCEENIVVAADYWGRTPGFQLLIYGAGEDEVDVAVRFDPNGRVVEVLLGNPDILINRDHREDIQVHSGDLPTPWEQVRDSNPPCCAGDRLMCPSGLVGTVTRLRDRYDNDIEQLRDYNTTHDILQRLGRDVYSSVEQAWDINPLTVGTTNPADFSMVPEYPKTSEYPHE